jgi:hypothetical protein
METDNSKAGSNDKVIHPQNKKNLAALLGVSVFILRKMIREVKDELGEPCGTTYSINQVKFMIDRFGIIEK